MTIQQLLHQAKNQLISITDNPALEAEVLLACALNKPRSFLHAWPEKKVSPAQLTKYMDYMQRRCRKEPIAYITGKQEFWSLDLIVTPDTLIPRPETEILVEKVLELLGIGTAHTKVADLGTGSGAIALALASERPAWQLIATDVSDNTLQIARKNAQRLALKNISFFSGSWCTALLCLEKSVASFDAIVSNPPYIAKREWEHYAEDLAFEPNNALVSGIDGLEAIREIIQSTKHFLRPSGYLLIEHGFLQAPMVREIFAAAGYGEICSERDLSGHERITVGRAKHRMPAIT